MHWGVRRYQNNDGTLTKAGKARYGTAGEAKNIKKRLTSLDEASGEAQYDYKTHEIKRQKYIDKSIKTKNEAKSAKYQEKAKMHEAERDAAERRVKNITGRINDTVNKAMKDGYDITMTRIGRMPSGMKGRQFAYSLMAGPIGGAALTAAREATFKKYGQQSAVSEGFMYKVTPGAGIVTEKRKDLKLV